MKSDLVCPRTFFFMLFVTSITGCYSGTDRVKMKSLAPSASAKKAIAELDKNGDGKLDVSECRPSLAVLLEYGDKNSDQMLDEEEIRQRLDFHQSEQVAIITAGIYLRSGRHPVSGAVVRLVPDPIFENLAVATGTSDEFGFVQFLTDGESLPGVYCGLYNIEVVKNGQTKTLSVGLEVGHSTGRGNKIVQLK